MKSMMARLDRLETDVRRTRSAHSGPFADGVLDRLTDAELHELGDLFRRHGAEYLEDMPADAQARAMELLAAARARPVQSTNPAAARAGGTRAEQR